MSTPPEILLPGRDDARLAALSDLPRRDLSAGLLAELARVRDPAQRRPLPAAALPRLPWVYLPWRQTLFRVLERACYREVRLSRNREVINPTEQAALAAARVGIVGMSVGHMVARCLALEGIGRFRLIDDDALELSNLNRVPAGLVELGQSKAEICAQRLWELDPFLDIELLPGRLEASACAGFVDGLDVVVDACDSFAIKGALRGAAAAARRPLVMETSYRGTLDLENYRRDPGHAPFHGALDGAPPPASPDGRVAMFERLLGPLSPRVEQTLRGLDVTFVSYPQTASDVVLGGASVTRLVRSLVLGEDRPSGRWRVDLEAILSEEPEQ